MMKHPATRVYNRTSLNLLVFLLISTFGLLLVSFFFTTITGIEEPNMNQSLLCNYIAMYGMAFPTYLLMSKPMEKIPPEKHKMSFGSFLICLMICVGQMVAGNLVGTVINVILTTLLPNTEAYSLNAFVFNENPYFFLFLAVICAPIIEEIILRKVFIDRVRKFGDGWAILFSGLLFGFLHGNFTQFFYATFLGWFLAFIYVKTGKLQYTIAMHMILNFLGSAVPFLLMGDTDITTLLSDTTTEEQLLEMLPDLIPLLLFVGAEYLVAFAGIIIGCCSIRKMELDPPMEKTTGKQICAAVCLWLFIITSFATFIISMI